ncbi:MAG: hypothetical protein GEU74_17075, partial [Nitriliruptorales bacterium]|nr:hypothetical protein [Nitriliruptorales bacterium]
MTRFKPTRDEELGAALRDLDVPEHRPAFHAEVRARLESAKAARRAAEQRRSVAWRFAAAAAVVAIVASAVVVGGTRDTVEMASAAEVRQRVVAAWAAADSIGGTLVFNDRRTSDREKRRWEFLLTARGDLRLRDRTRGGALAYDADRNVERSLNVSESIPDSDVLFASERRGLAPGWPDQGPAMDILERNLGAVVRALAAGGDASVKETTYRGRAAWVLDSEIRVNLIVPDDSPNHLTVTVDQKTGFPLRIIAAHDEQVLWTTRMVDLEVDAPV